MHCFVNICFNVVVRVRTQGESSEHAALVTETNALNITFNTNVRLLKT